MSPSDVKALENRHNPGWFTRPEKFITDRPSSLSKSARKSQLDQSCNSKRSREIQNKSDHLESNRNLSYLGPNGSQEPTLFDYQHLDLSDHHNNPVPHAAAVQN